jgi:hypothetical protein
VKCAKVRPRLGDHLEGDLDLAKRARIDEHLSDCASCANELRELRSTVAQIRSLPTPNPPSDLVDNVMRRIEAREGRRQPIVAAIRRLLDPAWAAPLAAGIVGLALFASTEIELVSPPEVVATAPNAAPFAAQKEFEMWTAQPPTLARNQVFGPRITAIERRAAHRFYRPDPVGVAAGFYGRVDPDSQQLDLDDRLDRARLDPAAFLRLLGALSEAERDSTIAPLVIRATRRGDAPAVARHLRATSHPLAASIAAQFDLQSRQPARLPVVIPVSTR